MTEIVIMDAEDKVNGIKGGDVIGEEGTKKYSRLLGVVT